MARVLVTTEGTDAGIDAIRTALDLLGRDHDYVFLTVGRPPMPVTALGAGGDAAGLPALPDPEAVQELTEECELEARAALDTVLARLHVTGRRRVEIGDPGATIIEVAAEEQADLIVVGATHAGVVRRLLGGSVADRVAHHAPCPVLITRPGHTETGHKGRASDAGQREGQREGDRDGYGEGDREGRGEGAGGGRGEGA